MSEINNFEAIDADLNHFDLIFPSFQQSNSEHYYNSASFNSKFTETCYNDLSLIHLNIRSFHRNGDAFLSFLATLDPKFDLICLTETWANNVSLASPFPNHNLFESIRPYHHGGGVAIYAHKRFSCKLIPDLTKNSNILESVVIQIKFSNKSLLVGAFYRPPHSNPEEFTDYFNACFSRFLNNNTEALICGDFNLDLLKISDDLHSNTFYNTVNSLSLIPTIMKPTRITDFSYSLIDNILTNYFENFSSGIFTI